jgi:hypothetical protein
MDHLSLMFCPFCTSVGVTSIVMYHNALNEQYKTNNNIQDMVQSYTEASQYRQSTYSLALSITVVGNELSGLYNMNQQDAQFSINLFQ